MILIISREDDRTTNEAINWLPIYGKEFIRMNIDDKFS